MGQWINRSFECLDVVVSVIVMVVNQVITAGLLLLLKEN
jgi:hypothetical protein